jgi:hypothetical protein
MIGSRIQERSGSGKNEKYNYYTEEKVADGAVRSEVKIFFEIAFE